MIKSNRNAMGNAANPYQGDYKKVLCVCSAGLLRSATMAMVLHKEYGYNVRNCGVSEEYALIPISEALVYWADEIVFAETSHYNQVAHELHKVNPDVKVITLNIPDIYAYYDPRLCDSIKNQYAQAKEDN